MQIVSTNLGKKKMITYRGKEVETGIFKYPVAAPLLLGKEDVRGDAVIDRRYHGGIDKACYLYSADHYPFWKEAYPNLEWSWGMFGENLTVAGLNESELHIGDIFRIGTATVQISQPRQPCFKLGIRLGDPAAAKRFVQAERPGAYVRVIQEGTVQTGDDLQLERYHPKNSSLADVFRLLYNPGEHSEAVQRAIEMAELAGSCRDDLIKISKK
jgi:MOSC domain-containing protein YiiM